MRAAVAIWWLGGIEMGGRGHGGLDVADRRFGTGKCGLMQGVGQGLDGRLGSVEALWMVLDGLRVGDEMDEKFKSGKMELGAQRSEFKVLTWKNRGENDWTIGCDWATICSVWVAYIRRLGVQICMICLPEMANRISQNLPDIIDLFI